MQLPPSSLPAAHPLPHTLVLERGASSEGGRSGRRLSPSLPPCAEGSDRPFSPARGELCPPAPGAFKGRLGGRDGTHNPPCPASPCFTTAASRASGAGGEPPALAPSPPTGSAELSSGSGPRRAAEAIAAHPSPSPRREGGDGAQPPPPPPQRGSPQPPRPGAAPAGPAALPSPRPPSGLPHAPAQERLFQILSSRMMMAARWDKSPVRRKMFMAAAAEAAAQPGAGERRWRKLSGHRATWPGDVARQPPRPVHPGKREGAAPPLRPAPPTRRGWRSR